jgi:hypothetical protein
MPKWERPVHRYRKSWSPRKSYDAHNIIAPKLIQEKISLWSQKGTLMWGPNEEWFEVGYEQSVIGTYRLPFYAVQRGANSFQGAKDFGHFATWDDYQPLSPRYRSLQTLNVKELVLLTLLYHAQSNFKQMMFDLGTVTRWFDELTQSHRESSDRSKSGIHNIIQSLMKHEFLSFSNDFLWTNLQSHEVRVANTCSIPFELVYRRTAAYLKIRIDFLAKFGVGVHRVAPAQNIRLLK